MTRKKGGLVCPLHYSMDLVQGCDGGCDFCWVPPSREGALSGSPPLSSLQEKIKTLRRRIRGQRVTGSVITQPFRVVIGEAGDPLQDPSFDLVLRKALPELRKGAREVTLLTKRAGYAFGGILEDPSWGRTLKKKGVVFGVSVTTEGLSMFEQGASSLESREATLRQLAELKIRRVVKLAPLPPLLHPDEHRRIMELVDRTRPERVTLKCIRWPKDMKTTWGAWDKIFSRGHEVVDGWILPSAKDRIITYVSLSRGIRATSMKTKVGLCQETPYVRTMVERLQERPLGLCLCQPGRRTKR